MRRTKVGHGEFKPILSKDRCAEIRGIVEQCYAFAEGKISDKPVDPMNRLNIDELIKNAKMSIFTASDLVRANLVMANYVKEKYNA